MVALALAATVVINGQRYQLPGLSQTLVPAFGLAVAAAFAPMLARRHPDEPWLPKLLLFGVAAKIVGSLARYLTLVDAFGNVGDATNYHEWGIRLTEGTHELENRTGTNFVRWFTSIVYEVVGIDIVTGFFVYGLLAFVGAYFWYRATADAVPFVNKRLYAIFVFFAPSVVFWPSSIGKEALMLLGVGVMVMGLAQLLQQRVIRGLMIAAPGAWLVWVVRPHLLAMVVLASGIAYLVGRSFDARGLPAPSSLMRPVGMLALLLVAMFAVSQAADFLGIEELSIEALEEELDEQTGRSAQGGSEFESGTRLTPLSVPQGAVTVLLRPFPWEVESGFQILASLEVTAITLFLLLRLPSLVVSLRYWRRTPFLAFCWTFLAMYSLAFASFANFGLLVRQRSLVLPALFVLIAVEPVLARRREETAANAAEPSTEAPDSNASERGVPSDPTSPPCAHHDPPTGHRSFISHSRARGRGP